MPPATAASAVQHQTSMKENALFVCSANEMSTAFPQCSLSYQFAGGQLIVAAFWRASARLDFQFRFFCPGSKIEATVTQSKLFSTFQK
jgi:hypothetical protein